jgi:ATP-grasp domain
LNSRRPSVLLVAAKWWPLSARLAIALVRHRCRVRVVCPAGHLLTHISGLDRVDRYAGLDSLACLRRSLREFNPDIIVPCDDGVVAQLHALHRQQPTMREAIERSLGSPENYSIVSSRYKLLSTAMDLGISVPKTAVITCGDDLTAWHETVASASVLKVDGESGGNGVRITRSLRESVAAWRQLGARRSFGAAWKRMAIDRYPLALWMRNSQSDREIIAQAFVRGQPANSMFACRQGKVLSMVCVAVVVSDGPIGAATIIRRISNESMSKAAELLAARLQLTGFYGLDFIIESATDTPYLIEMNPRCTQLGHLEYPDQGSLAGVFSAALRNESPPAPIRPISNATIALFPQAGAVRLARQQYIDSSYYDVPWDEPQLVRELLLEPWPQRRWAARLYHTLRRVDKSEPVIFEETRSAAGA